MMIILLYSTLSTALPFKSVTAGLLYRTRDLVVVKDIDDEQKKQPFVFNLFPDSPL